MKRREREQRMRDLFVQRAAADGGGDPIPDVRDVLSRIERRKKQLRRGGLVRGLGQVGNVLLAAAACVAVVRALPAMMDGARGAADSEERPRVAASSRADGPHSVAPRSVLEGPVVCEDPANSAPRWCVEHAPAAIDVASDESGAMSIDAFTPSALACELPR
jgi:hypothetical protein